MDKERNFPVFALFLFTAIIIYGLFGSPTPNNPGIIEAVIGGLLVLSIGAGAFKRNLNIFVTRNFFLKSLQIMFLCGLILPTLSGVYYGNDKMLMIRDVVAFAFLGLPLFLSERLALNDRAAMILPYVMILCGILFCVRTLMPVFNVWVPAGELLYLSNSPLALFAAVFLAGRFWMQLQIFSGRSAVKACVLLLALGILLGAMILDVQRATIGAVLISLVILAVLSFVEAPRKAIVPALVLAGVTFAFYPLISETLHAMAQKTSQVGLNMRTQEAAAVYDTIRADPTAFFIGQGWGSVFASPAVGGLEVNYTHSLLTTMALKGGLILFGLSLLVTGGALYQIFVIFQRTKIEGMALFWPLVIPVFLYASHKSLDFGLVLLLIGVWSIQGQALHKSHTSCKKIEHL